MKIHLELTRESYNLLMDCVQVTLALNTDKIQERTASDSDVVSYALSKTGLDLGLKIQNWQIQMLLDVVLKKLKQKEEAL